MASGGSFSLISECSSESLPGLGQRAIPEQVVVSGFRTLRALLPLPGAPDTWLAALILQETSSSAALG